MHFVAFVIWNPLEEHARSPYYRRKKSSQLTMAIVSQFVWLLAI